MQFSQYPRGILQNFIDWYSNWHGRLTQISIVTCNWKEKQEKENLFFTDRQGRPEKVTGPKIWMEGKANLSHGRNKIRWL